MSIYDDFINKEPLATFSIVKLSDQLFPEIEQQFINHHFGRIKKKWHVINQAGNSIDLTFNNHYELPLIKKGWNQFKTGNNLPDNVEIILPVSFANFLKTNLLYNLTLCTDDGSKENFEVINIADASSLGHTWRDFCTSNSFKQGHTVRFKFLLAEMDGKCQVYKLPN
ncbi:laccase [Trifolium repens]|nr:laccase [Trifolium repens]